MIDYENPGFTLDLKFLLYGTDFYPLSTLTPYERYILYMVFAEGRNANEVAKRLKKSHITIRRQLCTIRNNLRRLYYEEEDAS